MSILNKKIGEITFSDIEKLVCKDKPEENEFLDYKKEFSQSVRDNIHKLISAFANTYGGWIFIGIDEEDNSNKPKEIVNVEDKKLDNLIESICFDRISPPIFCSSRYIENESGDKRVFVIRIEESDMTPHAVDYNTTVYVKVKGQKRPQKRDEYKKADMDEIGWLKNRRQRYVERRNSLIERCHARYSRLFPGNMPDHTSSEFLLIPKYPRKELIESYELPSFLQHFQSTLPSEVRYLDLLKMKTVHESIIVSSRGIEGLNHFTEINGYGLYMNKAIYNKEDVSGYETNKHVPFLDIAVYLHHNIYVGVKLLGGLGIAGAVFLSYSLYNPIGETIFLPSIVQIATVSGEKLSSNIDDHYEFSKEIDLMQLQQKESELFHEIIDGIVFTFGGGASYKKGEIGNRIAKLLSKEGIWKLT